jgi:hypothetical protein
MHLTIAVQESWCCKPSCLIAFCICTCSVIEWLQGTTVAQPERALGIEMLVRLLLHKTKKHTEASKDHKWEGVSQDELEDSTD